MWVSGEVGDRASGVDGAIELQRSAIAGWLQYDERAISF
jgi:hypothetical protein